jgi:hypothetical protein
MLDILRGMIGGAAIRSEAKSSLYLMPAGRLALAFTANLLSR